MHLQFHNLLLFMTGVLFPTYNILEWVNKHFDISTKLRRLLIRSEREAALYLQYKEQAMRAKVKS